MTREAPRASQHIAAHAAGPLAQGAPRGALVLVPTPLDFGGEPAQPLDVALPAHTLRRAASIHHWVVENAKSARAFLKRLQSVQALAVPLQTQCIEVMPRELHKHGDHAAAGDTRLQATLSRWLQPALQGHDVGLLSEAGMPAIADPGSSVVRAAHALGLAVEPLVGPNALMLALAGSGLNGQHFAFVGYLPQDAAERAARVRALEAQAERSGQAQIVIETPYRNAALWQALVQTLKPATRLALCCQATMPAQSVRSATVGQWRQSPAPPALDGPAVFLFGP